MKHKIALLTDSTCDIPQEFLDKYDIKVYLGRRAVPGWS